jgi:hypothetical protein
LVCSTILFHSCRSSTFAHQPTIKEVQSGRNVC